MLLLKLKQKPRTSSFHSMIRWYDLGLVWSILYNWRTGPNRHTEKYKINWKQQFSEAGKVRSENKIRCSILVKVRCSILVQGK